MNHFVFKFLTTIFFVSVSFISFSQPGGGNVFKKGTDEYKMFMARQDYYGGDYRSALNKYKEVMKNRPNDAEVHFFVGQCYYMMKTVNDALFEFEQAKSLNPNAHPELSLFLGMAYHSRGTIDKALDEFIAFRKTIFDNPKKIQESEVDIFISQCNVAKTLMAKPVNAKLIHLLDINSQFDDKGPVLLNGDKVMLFTSRRPADDKSKVDIEGDYGFYDDVYESYWSDEKKTWLSAEPIRGPINTAGYDAVTSVSADGTMLFLYRNDPVEARGGEIFLSTKSTSGKWKTPEIFLKPVNTSYYEDAGCISPDGNTLYFVSERPGGLGRGDVWTSKKNIDGTWSEPVNIGAPVNTPFDENGLYLCPDGKTLFLCSNGPGSMGSYDIFRTTLDTNGKFATANSSSGEWTTPVNIGYPINSVSIESKLALTADRKTAYISTVRDTGLGERDIFMVDISNYDILHSPPLINMDSVSRKNESVFIASKKTAYLKGKIMSSDYTPLSAEIKILHKTTGEQLASVRSDNQGFYSVEVSSNTLLIFEVAAEGFQKFSEEISPLPEGKTASKNIILNKAK